MTHPQWPERNLGRRPPNNQPPWGASAYRDDVDRIGRPYVRQGMPPVAGLSQTRCPYCLQTFYGLTDPLGDHVEHCPRNPKNLLPVASPAGPPCLPGCHGGQHVDHCPNAPAGSSLAVGRAPVAAAGGADPDPDAYAITVATITQFAAVFGYQVHDYGYELIQLIAVASDRDRDRLALGYPTEVLAYRYWTQGDTRPSVGELVTFLRQVNALPDLNAGARRRLAGNRNPGDAS